MLRKWANGAAWPALAQDCALCGAGSGRELLCADCYASLPLASPEAGVVAAFEYRFPVDRMVLRFKHGGDLALGRWLGRALARRVAGEPPPDVIVATPLAAARLRERGFNQALEIAREVGRGLDRPVPWDALRRVRETPPQQGLSKAGRRRNVRGAFRCDAPMRGRRVAIVDDVYTTGATAAAMARALRAAGARETVVWAVARTPPPDAP